MYSWIFLNSNCVPGWCLSQLRNFLDIHYTNTHHKTCCGKWKFFQLLIYKRYKVEYNENLSKNASVTLSSFYNDMSDAPNITSPVLFQGAQQREWTTLCTAVRKGTTSNTRTEHIHLFSRSHFALIALLIRSFFPYSLSHSLTFPLFHLASPVLFKLKLVSWKIFSFYRDIFVCNLWCMGIVLDLLLSVKCSVRYFRLLMLITELVY